VQVDSAVEQGVPFDGGQRTGLWTNVPATVWAVAYVAAAVLMYRLRVSREMVDFDVYRVAALRAMDAAPLYQDADGHYLFKYLPAFALAAAPLGFMSQSLGKALWFACSTGLLAAFVLTSAHALPDRRQTIRILVWITVVFMAKFYARELGIGQSNVLLGTLLVGMLVAAQAGRVSLAGVLAGAAVFVKPYALLLLVWLVVTYGRTAAIASLSTVVAGLVLPATVYGWSGNLALLSEWYRVVTGSTESNLLGADSVSLASMWAKWIGIGTAATMMAILSTFAVLGLGGLLWLRRGTVRSPAYLEAALLMLLVPLISPQGWDYVLLLGTPAVICLVDRWQELEREWKFLAALSLALMGLTLFDIMGRELYAQFMALSLVTVAALGVAASMARLRWKRLA